MSKISALLAALWLQIRMNPSIVPQAVAQALAFAADVGFHLPAADAAKLSAAAAFAAAFVTWFNTVPSFKAAALVHNALYTDKPAGPPPATPAPIPAGLPPAPVT